MALRYLLDTNICIYITKQKPISVLEKFQELVVGEVGMSTVTYGELVFGAIKSHHPKKALVAIEEFKGLVPPLPISTEAGRYYGEVRALLEKRGKPIGNNDLWIAAHALALDVILVTNNIKEFARIPQLEVENWVGK